MEILNDFNQVLQGASQTVQFPDGQDISLPKYAEALRQLRLFPKLANIFFLKDLFCPGFLPMSST